MSLLHDAKLHISKYPSIAVDSGTQERTTIHLLTRMLNNMCSSAEYSGSQAVSHALGLAANYTMHKKVFIFSDQAIAYVNDFNLPISDTDQNSDVSSFSSGIYSPNLTNSEGSSSSSESEHHPDILDYSEKDISMPPLSEEEEFGHPSVRNILDSSDSDSDDIDFNTHARAENLLRRSAARHGSICPELNVNGKLCVVTQAEDYHFRPIEFVDFSLYEFVCTTFRREKERKKKESSSSNSSGSDSDKHQSEQNPETRRGRKRTTLFTFQAPHQLMATHAIALLKKISVAHFIKKVPPYPGPRPIPLTDPWKTRARVFAQFALTIYKPWQGSEGLPGPTTWHAFCTWIHELKQSDTILSRTRYAFVLNAAHNLKSSSAVSKILKQYRGSAATRWLQMEPQHRPKKWRFGDEAVKEPDLKTKNTREEAELAMRELLHKVCDSSPSETKKSQLLNHTVNAYRDAIAPNLHLGHNIQNLFREKIPDLHDRIDCFTTDSIEKVRDYNLKKQYERTMEAKLKQTKLKRPKRSKVTRSASPPSSRSNVDWSPQQKTIVTAVSDFLDAFTDWRNGRCPAPKSLSMLIFGGPGVGKTTVLKELSTMCKLAEMPLISSAATGVAAGAMHDAGTNHSKYALPVYASHETDPDDYLPPLSKHHINTLMADYEESLANGTPLAIAIDECSMLAAQTFGRILRRIQEFEQDFIKSKPPPPRLFILVGVTFIIKFQTHSLPDDPYLHAGDFFQIPPCKATPMYATVLDNTVLKKPSQPGSAEDVGARFFSSFKLFHLDTQFRSLDPIHSENLKQLRCLDPTIYPFTNTLLSHYNILDSADILGEPEWLVAPVVVLFNQLRHALNLEGMKLFSKAVNFPIISWRNNLHGTNAASLTATETNLLYATHPSLSGFFVPGAPAYGKTNLNTQVGLFNGARMKLYSLSLDKNENKQSLIQKLRSTRPGEVVVLDYPPFSVQVEITDAPPDTFTRNDTLLPGRYVVPLMVDSKSQHETIKPFELLRRQGTTMTSIKYRSHSYDLGFSLTYEKTQSKSFPR